MAETRTTSSTGGQKGVKLARFDLIPAGPLRELAEHYGKGARKYDSHQWRKGYEWSKSIGAIGRHFNDFMAGRDYDVCSNDPEGCSFVTAEGEPFEPTEPDTCYNHTGSHHMAAVAWHSFLLLEFKDTHPQHDDRFIGDGPDIDFEAAAREILGEGSRHPRMPGEAIRRHNLADFVCVEREDTMAGSELERCSVCRPQEVEIRDWSGNLVRTEPEWESDDTATFPRVSEGLNLAFNPGNIATEDLRGL